MRGNIHLQIKIFHFYTNSVHMVCKESKALFNYEKIFVHVSPSPNPFLDEFYCKMFKIMKKTKTRNKMNPPKRPGFLKNKINQRKIPLNLQQYFNWKKGPFFSGLSV